MSPRYPIIQAIAGSIVGLALAIFLEIVLIGILQSIIGYKMRLTGLGWLVAPICLAVLGWKLGKNIGIDYLIGRIRKYQN